jgi:hypothetical protein
LLPDSFTNRWLSVLGIGTVLFGISLFVLRIPERTIIVFFALGLPVVLLWLYVDKKSKRQKKEIDAITDLRTRPCVCSICKHEKAANCVNQKCPCCIMMKGEKVVGHSINPLQ